ncbi:MAG: TerC family protein [Chroococcales cyanobacterium]
MLDQVFDSHSFHIGFDTSFVLIILIALEAVLSADNAIALASIAQGLDNKQLQRRALNFGLVAAYILRITLIITATWVIQFWQFEVLGALYLLWLVFKYFSSPEDEEHSHSGPKFASLWQAIPMIAVTDLAFSLDSVTTAIAVSEETWLIIAGGTIGVIALRFLAGLFIRWLDEFTHLEDAGYITVAFVGIRLLMKAISPELVPPQWAMFLLIVSVFAWGFSKRTQEDVSSQSEEEPI